MVKNHWVAFFMVPSLFFEYLASYSAALRTFIFAGKKTSKVGFSKMISLLSNNQMFFVCKE
jgi:hypothetical protein